MCLSPSTPVQSSTATPTFSVEDFLPSVDAGDTANKVTKLAMRARIELWRHLRVLTWRLFFQEIEFRTTCTQHEQTP